MLLVVTVTCRFLFNKWPVVQVPDDKDRFKSRGTVTSLSLSAFGFECLGSVWLFWWASSCSSCCFFCCCCTINGCVAFVVLDWCFLIPSWPCCYKMSEPKNASPSRCFSMLREKQFLGKITSCRMPRIFSFRRDAHHPFVFRWSWGAAHGGKDGTSKEDINRRYQHVSIFFWVCPNWGIQGSRLIMFRIEKVPTSLPPLTVQPSLSFVGLEKQSCGWFVVSLEMGESLIWLFVNISEHFIPKLHEISITTSFTISASKCRNCVENNPAIQKSWIPDARRRILPCRQSIGTVSEMIIQMTMDLTGTGLSHLHFESNALFWSQWSKGASAW